VREFLADMKFYAVALMQYLWATVVFLSHVEDTLKIIAAILLLISTVYLIRKYRKEAAMIDAKKRLYEMEIEIKHQEMANKMLETKAIIEKDK
jgi:predicted anti-sigma-YlaC factor YlaD